MRRPLVVTDAGVRAAGVLQMALDALGDLPHAVFDGTPSNPTEAAVREAVALLRREGCDGLVAVGGGSSIDLAKALAIAATHEGALATYATIEGGSAKITDRVLPLIAVPTTAGTGSEVARGAIVIVDDGRKLGFHSWHLMPKAALLEKPVDLPPHAGSSTDATYVPEPPLDEYWRQVVLDVVTPANAVDSAEVIERIGAWLVRHQPISLAVNGITDDAVHASCSAALPTADESAAAALALERLPHLRVARRLFETSALCVYSVGDASRPCLTAQARPQDGEIFGELPPLGDLVPREGASGCAAAVPCACHHYFP
jgi:hypothetical protein